jgi:4-amino-4-deoxy-L-arabinose transferase-like glycosyltransferase
VQIHNHPQSDGQKWSELKYIIALAALCALVNFYGLGSLPLIGPDEPRYAEVAREMYETGDWITPRLGGIKWFEKPALTYWLSAAGYKLFGLSEFAARFNIAVIASLGVLLIFFFGWRMRSSRFGYLSASVLVTCGLWPGFARGATFDLPLAVAISVGLLSFFWWESRDEPKGKNLWWWIFCFSLGLAVLAKGLVGIVLPVAIIGSYLLLAGRLKIVFRPLLLFVGALIFLAVASTWYWPVIARHGMEFIDEFFIAHHFQRYVSNRYKHPQPFYFFFLVAFAGSFPWSFFMASSAWAMLKKLRTKFDWEEDRFKVFLWLWVLAPIIFFSFSGSKLPGYILPVFPPIALLIGLELENWWADEEPRRMKLLAVATVFLIFGVALVVGLRGDSELGLEIFDSFTVATIAVMVAVVYLALWFLLSGRAATLFLPFGLAVVVATVVNIVFPVLGRGESLRELSLIARQMALPGERLVFYVNQDHGINFYATELPLRDERSELIVVATPEEVESLMRATGSRSILVASLERWANGVNETSSVKFQKLGEQKRNKSCSPECDWVLQRAQLK